MARSAGVPSQVLCVSLSSSSVQPFLYFLGKFGISCEFSKVQLSVSWQIQDDRLVLAVSEVSQITIQCILVLENSECLPRLVIPPITCPRRSIAEVGNLVLWVATKNIKTRVKELRVYSEVSVGRILTQHITIEYCGVTQLCSLKAIGTLSSACYLGDILCALAYCVIYLLPFCLPYEKVMIRVCNGQFDCCSFVFETWYLILKYNKSRL